MEEEARIAAVGRALAHPARVRILRLLASQAECRGADVFGELPLAQSTISEHLKILKEAGIVNARHSGTAMVYCLAPQAFDGFIDAVRDIAMSEARCAPSGRGS